MLKKVLTGVALCACMQATMVEESMPPERKAPSGTSASIRAATAFRIAASRQLIASCSLP